MESVSSMTGQEADTISGLSGSQGDHRTFVPLTLSVLSSEKGFWEGS